jgi:hypothetical protein
MVSRECTGLVLQQDRIQEIQLIAMKAKSSAETEVVGREQQVAVTAGVCVGLLLCKNTRLSGRALIQSVYRCWLQS